MKINYPAHRLACLLLVSSIFIAKPGRAQTGSQAQESRSDSAAPASIAAAASTLPSIASDDYLINPEDVLDIYVYDVPELSREYTVSAAGTVTIPLLPKPVQAAGLSPGQFARALEETFRQTGRLSRPQITVAIKQSRRSAVTVEGAVKLPQVVPVIGRTKLVSILSQCGGLADDAGSTATIRRGALAPRDPATGARLMTPAVTVELKKLMDDNDPTSQLDVWPGDRVIVEHAGVFYVLGEVNRPGGYNLKSAQEQVTILEALSIAGDVTSVAKKHHAKIIRKDATAATGRREVAINVKDILAGRSPDQVLQANDILYIPASGGKRALHTFTSATTTIATGAGTAVVYRR